MRKIIYKMYTLQCRLRHVSLMLSRKKPLIYTKYWNFIVNIYKLVVSGV